MRILSSDADHLFGEFKKEIEALVGFEVMGSLSWPQMWCSAWVLFRDFYVENDRVICMVGEKFVFSTPVHNVDLFVSFLHANGGDLLATVNFFDDLNYEYDVGESFTVNLHHYKKGVPEVGEQKGQLKLLVNAFEVLDKPKGNVLVLGGGGPYYATAGLTYHALAEALPNMNFLLYDPLEVAGKCGNLEIRAECFKYDNEIIPYPDFIIDDVYTLEPAIVEWEDGPVIDRIPPAYVGKFIIDKQGKNYVLVATPGTHSNHSCFNVRGGGSIDKRTEPIQIFGTSGKYGPYDDNLLRKKFSSWRVLMSQKFENVKNYEYLVDKYPRAAITTKALFTDYKESVIRSQHHYAGNERRAFFNCHLIPENGWECVVCHYVNWVARRWEVDTEVVRKLYVQVGGHSCKPHKHKTKVHVSFLLDQYARKWAPVDVVVEEVSRKTCYSAATVRSFMELKVRKGDLKVFKTYDGDRFANYKYTRPPSVVKNTDLQGFLLIMANLLGVKNFSGDYVVLGNGKLSGYVGSKYCNYAQIVVPVGMSSEDLHKLEVDYQLIEGPIRVFVDKRLPPVHLDSWTYFWDKVIMDHMANATFQGVTMFCGDKYFNFKTGYHDGMNLDPGRHRIFGRALKKLGEMMEEMKSFELS